MKYIKTLLIKYIEYYMYTYHKNSITASGIV